MKPIQMDTTLSEFTYTIAREAPVSLRRLLPEKYFRATSTEKAAMRFATKSTLEQKLEFFAYLGIEYYSIFADTKKGKISDFRDIFRKFDTEDDPSETLRKLTEANVYVSSNKELCFLLGFSSQIIDSPAYKRNLELIRTSYHTKKFKNKISIPEHSDAIEEKNNSFSLIKLIQSVLWASEMAEAMTGLKNQTIMILLYFYLNRSVYMTDETLMGVFAGGVSKIGIMRARRKLLKEMMLQPHAVKKRIEYTITGRGILVVNQFRDKVIKSFDF